MIPSQFPQSLPARPTVSVRGRGAVTGRGLSHPTVGILGVGYMGIATGPRVRPSRANGVSPMTSTRTCGVRYVKSVAPTGKKGCNGARRRRAAADFG